MKTAVVFLYAATGGLLVSWSRYGHAADPSPALVAGIGAWAVLGVVAAVLWAVMIWRRPKDRRADLAAKAVPAHYWWAMVVSGLAAGAVGAANGFMGIESGSWPEIMVFLAGASLTNFAWAIWWMARAYRTALAEATEEASQ